MATRFDNVQALVVDNGTEISKAGFAGDDAPRAFFPSIVGRPKFKSIMMNGMLQKECYIGDEACSKRGILNLKNTVERGIVNDWEDMEQIWHHTFYNELGIAPEEHPMLMTQTIWNPRGNREKMAQILFETFTVPAMYIACTSLLARLAYGRLEGMLIDSGHGITYAVPIYEGCVLSNSVMRLDLGGGEITEYLTKLLNESGHSFNTRVDRLALKDIKEKLCHVAINYEKELKEDSQSISNIKSYELPDGTMVPIGHEQFKCTEALFKPSLIGMEEVGIHEMIFKSIRRCSVDIRACMYRNLFLSGGNTMFSGFGERIIKELTELAPSSMKISLATPPERKYSTWIGGSILASLSSFDKLWVSKKEYEEAGSGIIHRRCYLE